MYQVVATPAVASVADSVTVHRPEEPAVQAVRRRRARRTRVVDRATVSSVNVTECVASTLPALSIDQNVIVCDPSETVNGAVYVCVEPPSTV